METDEGGKCLRLEKRSDEVDTLVRIYKDRQPGPARAETLARTEFELSVAERDHATVGTSTLVRVQGEPDRVVEGDANQRVNVLLADVEEAAWE